MLHAALHVSFDKFVSTFPKSFKGNPHMFLAPYMRSKRAQQPDTHPQKQFSFIFLSQFQKVLEMNPNMIFSAGFVDEVSKM